VESVESEIKSELMDKHPVTIWNDIDNLFNTLGLQNPITRAAQTKNGWSRSVDGVGPAGNMLHLDIVIKK